MSAAVIGHTMQDIERLRHAALIATPEIVTDVLSTDRSKMRITHAITTGVLNRNGHRVVQAGGDLTDYRKNPIVLFNHDSDRPGVGKSVGQEFERRHDRWVAETEFAPTQFGHELWTLYAGDYMKAWSIGFQPVPDAVEFTKNDRGDITEIIFNKWNLFEYSPVPIPANPDAVNQALRHKIISESTYRLLNLADELAPELAADPSQGLALGAALDSAATMRLKFRAAAELLEGRCSPRS